MAATDKQSPESKKEATNFHVMPKGERAREQAKQPAEPSPAAQSDVVSRDPEAGAVGTNPGVNQPTRDTDDDRSQVS